MIGGLDGIISKIRAMVDGDAQAAAEVQSLTLADLRLKTANGRSGWWFLALAASCKHPDAFMNARWRFKGALEFEDFLVTSEGGVTKGQSVLWVLARAASIGHVEVFKSVWREWRTLITAQHLQRKAEEGDHKDKSAVYLLFEAESEKIHSTRGIIEDILAYVPYVCSNDELLFKPNNDKPSIAELLQKGPYWSHQMTKLIAARNAFFVELAKLEVNPHPTDFKQIKRLAREALDAGYLNAFYELGKMFNKNLLEIEACKAYAKVPRNSRDYDQAIQIVQVKYFSLAISPNASERTKYFKKSLKFALKLPDALRLELIQKIAWCYITEGKDKGLTDFNIVPEHYLLAMHRKTKVTWCFKVFDDIKKAKMLEEKCAAQEKRIQQLEKEREEVEKLTALVSQLSVSNQGSQANAPLLYLYDASQSNASGNQLSGSLMLLENSGTAAKAKTGLI